MRGKRLNNYKNQWREAHEAPPSKLYIWVGQAGHEMEEINPYGDAQCIRCGWNFRKLGNMYVYSLPGINKSIHKASDIPKCVDWAIREIIE